MSDLGPLAGVGELAKPATVLIEKVSDAVGGVCKPWQIKRVARAEAEAAKIAALAGIEIDELQQRALQRMVVEEGFKQQNIESITAKAIPMLSESSDPSQVEDDWIADFFDKCRLISDDEMQEIWAAVLAGEANEPGSYSKRTVSLLASLDKADAGHFATLCRYSLDGAPLPLVYDITNEVYANQGLTFVILKQLDAIGLVSFEPTAGYRLPHLPKHRTVVLNGREMKMAFPKEDENDFKVGAVMLTQSGTELAALCPRDRVPGFAAHLVETWTSYGYELEGSESFAADDA
jgi:hypothetical protein